MYGVSKLDICEDVSVVTLNKMPLNLGVTADFFTGLGQAGIVIDMVSQTSPVGERVSIAFTCLDTDLRGVLDAAKKLREAHPDVSSLVSSGNVKLQLFGEEMRTASGVFARALSALADAGVEPQLITTSEIDISLLIPAPCLPGAKSAIERDFEL
ncbi:MAG: ACT domain-containing protein [Oscillospiraceae bacterium]|nr:ACT domain-containing protein [Oscillospiraceae bacterium]